MSKMTVIPRNYVTIRAGIVELLNSARSAAARSVNSIMTATYWETFDRPITVTESGLSQQVLPNGHGITTAARAELNELAKRLTGRRRFGIFWFNAPQPYAQPGGHLYGRF